MPHFDLALGGSVAVVPWTDPPLGAAHSRLNPKAGRTMLRHSIPAVQAGALAFVASVNGVLVSNASIAPFFFDARFLEWPGAIEPIFQPGILAGFESATQRTTLVDAGHYVFRVFRQGWGVHIVHVDNEP